MMKEELLRHSKNFGRSVRSKLKIPLMMKEELLPNDYDARLTAAWEKYNIQKKEGWDIVLDPIEQVPIAMSSAVDAAGNWGPTYLGINGRYAEIESKLKREVVVFIFDTAGEFTHPMLAKAAWNEKGKDYTGSTKADNNGHGTHCAGIIAAIDPNTPMGAARMMADKGYLKLIPRKVLGDGGSGSFSWISTALNEANSEAQAFINQGKAVVYSLSLGAGGTMHAPTEAALKAATEMGVLVFCAAGNTGTTPVNQPASSIYSIAIGALKQSGNGAIRDSYSTYGPQLFLAAPGSAILSTYKNNTTALLSGTSMATPMAAAVAAILLSVFNTASPPSIKAHFAAFATDIPPDGKDDYTGWGSPIINKLLDNPVSGTPPPPPPPPPPTDPEREERTLVHPFSASVIFQLYGSTTAKPLTLNFELSYKTKLYDETAYDKTKEAVTKFFYNRGFLLPAYMGFSDAAYWAAYFAEMLIKQDYKITVKVERITGSDEKGRQAILIRPTDTIRSAQNTAKRNNRFMMPSTFNY